MVVAKNQLTSLDVSKNTKLENLYCDENQLTSLNVSKNTNLTYLWCDKNQLTSLDVSNNTKLVSFICSNQTISLEAIKDEDSYYIELPKNVKIANIESVTGGEKISNGIALATEPQVGTVISYIYKVNADKLAVNDKVMRVYITISGVKDIKDINEITTEEETSENTTEKEIQENTTEKEIPSDTVEEPTSAETTATGNSVQTGDMNMPFIYTLLGMAGLLGVILTSVIRKRDLSIK